MADMSNEQWLAALRIELSQAGRWVEITSQTADRLEESDMQLAEYRNTPATDDSELQGELDLVTERNKEFVAMMGDIYGVCKLSGFPSGSGSEVDAVKWLADALAAERAKVAELQHQLETANAANARRAEESQLEPVGWVCRGGEPNIAFSATWDDATRGLSGHVNSLTRRRVYLGPAEPLEVPQ